MRAYARLREAGPVHRANSPDGASIWLVTRYADVKAGLGGNGHLASPPRRLIPGG
ncbi:hypothetical protein [Amycolatopsis sp. NBC_01480]|uniref:hypothetical protein n=1 Tax=Amycolatopsis sp. NBC_01480 TaxID=2903562 RepID=UPI002E2A30A3|nr:hypothetical protein [Amycolatopsis sp. NBC_01480]